MPRISFYSLPHSDLDSRLQFACRLTEKARQLGHRVFIQAENTDQAARLDRLLWTFKAASFLPHSLNASEQPQQEAVAVGTGPQLELHNDVVINLAPEPVQHHERFERINEIVCTDQTITERGREHYRFYQRAGYEIETFKI